MSQPISVPVLFVSGAASCRQEWTCPSSLDDAARAAVDF